MQFTVERDYPKPPPIKRVVLELSAEEANSLRICLVHGNTIMRGKTLLNNGKVALAFGEALEKRLAEEKVG